MADPVPIGVACAAIVLVGAGAAAVARPRAGKSEQVALAFATPGAGLVLAAAMVAGLVSLAIAIPLLACGTLCAAAGAIFLPTRGTRFREFERMFWAYVAENGRAHSLD